MKAALLSKVIINFHPVDWTDPMSVLPYLVGSSFGVVTKEAIHTSISVTLDDEVEYTYDITTGGVFCQRELPAPTARYSVSVQSFLDVTSRIKQSFDEGAHLSVCALLRVLLGDNTSGFYTCAGWVFWVVYGEIEEQGAFLNVSISTTGLLRRLQLESKLNGVTKM